ncbi:3-hydroxyacyl-CoA dehydrogenase NAD-binding domain-containing protein [Stenotrophomonas sp. MB339]|uniref:3-hydroxyacyl-CoA dehydrogenase NAD-binding domain-containing protein n=1 Tax=Stenotrophomonas sp. MB339 TaxID=1663558 RepID=UPI001C0E26DA|nr:3-hydroxyacyl-CoA dehydrogenase NAD-binding domain-containing protein [Stenotrophomonas sp. MB339]
MLCTGLLGEPVAFHGACHGTSGTAYDIDAAALGRARDALTRLAQTYAADLPGTTPEATTRVAAAIALSSDLAQAVRASDLVIEAVPDQLEL